MKPILPLVACMSFLFSCEFINGPTTVKPDVTSNYLLNGNLNVYLANNQIFRLKGKPGIGTIAIGNNDLSKYEDCFILHVATGITNATSVSSAVIKLDDLEVLNTSDFSKNTGQHQFEICNLSSTSVLTVEVKGQPGSYLDIWIEGKLKGLIVSDCDGNTYKTIKIGDQTWMSENLKTTRFNNGESIPFITDGVTWGALNTPGYCWYNNDATYKASYGALYNWYTVNTGILCPVGWHVPTIDEWTALNYYLVSNGYGYGGIDWQTAKSMGATSGWSTSLTNGAAGFEQASNNSSGFTGLPGGYRSEYGWFALKGETGHWWSSTTRFPGFADGSVLTYSSESPGATTMLNRVGFSVRCLKDK